MVLFVIETECVHEYVDTDSKGVFTSTVTLRGEIEPIVVIILRQCTQKVIWVEKERYSPIDFESIKVGRMIETSAQLVDEVERFEEHVVAVERFESLARKCVF